VDFALTEQQQAIADNVAGLCAGFDDAYWLACDRDARFPDEFYGAVAAAGWLGIAMPPEFGGAGLGVTEAALLMHEVARTGGMTAASSIHINIFGPHAIVVYGNEDQRRDWLPGIIQGKVKCCFGVTEPNAGLETGAIETRAERLGNGGYVVNGHKLWTSTAQRAQKIMLLVRTTPRDQCKRSTDGLTLFYTDLDRRHVEVRAIDKMGRAAVDSNAVFIDGLPVPAEHRIGEEGKGFSYLLHSLNPERVLIGAEGIGIGRSALDRAARYARERVVFGRPIGQNQSIQHPLAELWIELEAAWLTTMRAAWLYDHGQPCGPEANAAKYLGGETGFKACSQAILTLGGMGYAREFHVERLLREVMIVRLAPVSPQLILCNIAEKVLDLPKSY
jgi:acyl-CoA dehydrogenase